MVKTFRSFLLAAIPCLVLSAAPAFAVITGADPTGTSYDGGYSNIGSFPITALNNVGTIIATNGDQSDGYAACTYVRNGWVIVPYHVVTNGSGGIEPTLTVNFGGGNIVASGSTAIRLTNPSDSSNTDLVLFQLPSIPSEVSNVTVATSSPALNTGFYNGGFGGTRSSALEYFDSSFNVTSNPSDYMYQGYSVNSFIQTLDWGQNSVDVNLGTDEDPSSTAVVDTGNGNETCFASAFLNSSLSDQITPGDSGGGVFTSSDELIGINEGEQTVGSQDPLDSALVDYNDNIGDLSIFGDLATYSTEINTDTAVPEPTTGVLLMAIALPVLARRQRSATKSTAL